MLSIRRGLSREEADELATVLAAAGIAHRLEPRKGGVSLKVREHERDRAEAELSAFAIENPPGEEEEAPPPPPPLRSRGGVIAAASVAAFYLLLGATSQTPGLATARGALSRAIMEGELSRTVTALFLHVDFLHLIGNMAGFLVFGTAVCSAAGAGAGIFLMLISGIAGNLANAWFHGPGHLSVGASTAVFGAVGILTGTAFLHRRNEPKAWLAPAAGVVFIALLGNSERADFFAHAWGFAAGLALGLGWGRLVPEAPGKKAQALFFLAALVLVAAGFAG